MKVIEFVLLLYIGNGELIEYTVRDGLSDCLSTKRTIERNMQIIVLVVKGDSCKRAQVKTGKTR